MGAEIACVVRRDSVAWVWSANDWRVSQLYSLLSQGS